MIIRILRIIIILKLAHFETKVDEFYDEETGENKLTALTIKVGKIDVDIDSIEKEQYTIDDSGKWSSYTSENLHISIPCKPNATYEIIANATISSYYALLKDKKFAVGTSANFCDGEEGRYSLAAGETIYVDTPADCNYIYVSVKLTAGECMPQDVKLMADVINDEEVNEHYTWSSSKIDSTKADKSNVEDIEKDVKKLISEEENIDLSSCETKDYNIDSSGIWNTNTNKHIDVPVEPNTEYIIIGHASIKTYYSFLPLVQTAVASKRVTICDGTDTRYTLNANESVQITTPSDCNVINISVKLTTGECMPQSLVKQHISEIINDNNTSDYFTWSSQKIAGKIEKKNVSDKALRFMVVSDLHYGRTDAASKSSDERVSLLLNRVNEEINSENGQLDFLIFNGDIIDHTDGEDVAANIADFKSRWAWKFPIPIYYTLGNHDSIGSGDTDADLEAITSMYGIKSQYSLESDDFYFVFLNAYYNNMQESGKWKCDGADMTFAEAELTKAKALNKIPVLITHQLQNYTTDDNIATLVQNYGVEIVIYSHTHVAVNNSSSTYGRIVNPGAFVIDSVNPTNYSYALFEMGTTAFMSSIVSISATDGSISKTSKTVFEIDKDVHADFIIGRKSNLTMLINKLSNN